MQRLPRLAQYLRWDTQPQPENSSSMALFEEPQHVHVPVCMNSGARSHHPNKHALVHLNHHAQPCMHPRHYVNCATCNDRVTSVTGQLTWMARRDVQTTSHTAAHGSLKICLACESSGPCADPLSTQPLPVRNRSLQNLKPPTTRSSSRTSRQRRASCTSAHCTSGSHGPRRQRGARSTRSHRSSPDRGSRRGRRHVEQAAASLDLEAPKKNKGLVQIHQRCCCCKESQRIQKRQSGVRTQAAYPASLAKTPKNRQRLVQNLSLKTLRLQEKRLEKKHF